VHDIGRFYLMSRAAAYPDLVEHAGELDALIRNGTRRSGRRCCTNST
jgi:hypothetical protein